MRDTVPILKDKLAVLETKAAYEVLHDILALFQSRIWPNISPVPEEENKQLSIKYITDLKKNYQEALVRLGQQNKVHQKDLEDEISEMKNNII